MIRASVVLVYLREAGKPAALRAAPFYFGLLVVCTILFGGPNAMRASDAVGAFAASPPVRLFFWVAWIAAATPAVRILFQTKSTEYLRTLPGTGPPIVVALVLGLLAVEAPWVALFARGAGPLAGVATFLAAAALHASVVAPLPLAGLVVLGTILWPLPEIAFVAVGLGAAVYAIRGAYRKAPERAARPRRNWVGGPPSVALARALLASSFRATPAAVTRGVLVAVAGGALTALVTLNNHAVGSLPLALGMSGPILVVAAGGVVEVLAASERETSWILVTTGAGAAVARALAAGVSGAVLGLLVASVLVGFAGGGAALVSAAGGWGAVIAILVAVGEKLAGRSGRRETGVAVVWNIAVAIVSAVFAGLVLP